jgi:hypothetical protein
VLGGSSIKLSNCGGTPGLNGAGIVDGPPEPGRNRSSQPGVQAGRKALRIRHINGMEVRKKRPRGFKKEAQGAQVSPLNPLSVAP